MKVDKNIMAIKRLPDDARRLIEARKKVDAGGLIAVGLMALAFLLVLFAFTVRGAEITEEVAIRCIIGEASNQGYEGMVAVGEALRNRGTTRGVYGCDVTRYEPAWVWDMARRAWDASQYSNLVDGADHWHNVRREGETYWTVKMEKTICIKDHCFYRER